MFSSFTGLIRSCLLGIFCFLLKHCTEPFLPVISALGATLWSLMHSPHKLQRSPKSQNSKKTTEDIHFVDSYSTRLRLKSSCRLTYPQTDRSAECFKRTKKHPHTEVKACEALKKISCRQLNPLLSLSSTLAPTWPEKTLQVCAALCAFSRPTDAHLQNLVEWLALTENGSRCNTTMCCWLKLDSVHQEDGEVSLYSTQVFDHNLFWNRNGFHEYLPVESQHFTALNAALNVKNSLSEYESLPSPLLTFSCPDISYTFK